MFTTDTELNFDSLRNAEIIVANAVIPGNFLRPERYCMTLAAYIPNQLVIDFVQDAFSATIIDGGSKYPASVGLDYGRVFVDCDWSIKPGNTFK